MRIHLLPCKTLFNSPAVTTSLCGNTCTTPAPQGTRARTHTHTKVPCWKESSTKEPPGLVGQTTCNAARWRARAIYETPARAQVSAGTVGRWPPIMHDVALALQPTTIITIVHDKIGGRALRRAAEPTAAARPAQAGDPADPARQPLPAIHHRLIVPPVHAQPSQRSRRVRAGPALLPSPLA